MTISTETRKAGPFPGNGVTTVFPFAFKVFKKGDLVVALKLPSGATTTLVLDSVYSVTLNTDQDGNPGGSITYPLTGDAMAIGYSLSGASNVPNTQPTDLINSGGFYPRVVEEMVDRSTIQIQQLSTRLDSVLQLALPDQPGEGAYDADENRIENLSDPVSDQDAVNLRTMRAADQVVHDYATELFNNIPGPTFQAWYPELFRDGVNYTSGTSTHVTLEGTANDRVIAGVFFDSAFQDTTQWTLADDGVTVNFGNPIPLGVSTVSVMYYAPGQLGFFQQAGTGIVPRTYQSKMRDVYDIRDFGAKCDGVTDDADAINLADAAVVSLGGGILMFPAGTLIIGSTLLRGSNVIWQGAGIGATVIKAKDHAVMNWMVSTINADALWGTGSVSGAYAFGHRDITLDGNKAGGAFVNGFGIYGATFNLQDYEIANCTGVGLRTEFGIPGVIPHGYNSQSSSTNSLIHDCNANGMVWGGPSDPSIVNNDVYRNQPCNIVTQVNGTGCKFINCHVWGSIFDNRLASTGMQLNTAGNLMVNCAAEGSTVHQVHVRSNANVILGGNIYYFSDATKVYGVTLGDVAAGIVASNNSIKTRIDNCQLGAINFNSDGGQNSIDIDGYNNGTGTVGFTGAPGPLNMMSIRINGAAAVGNSNMTIIPTDLYLALGGGTGRVSAGAADSGGSGFRMLRVPN